MKEIEWLLQEKYQGVKNADFYADCARLEAGEPLAYIIGAIPFLNCQIYLDSRPLIPRTETEFWVERVISEINSSPQSIVNILDLCAGSGCIGVAIAKAIPHAKVTFAEIDQTHLPTIQKNCEESKLPADRYSLVASDLYQCIEGTYDYILSNPPYIDKTTDQTDQSVLDHEPHQALFGGEKGLECIQKIIEESPRYLTPGGQLWIEHEPEQVAAVSNLATDHYASVITHPDQYGISRYSVFK